MKIHSTDQDISGNWRINRQAYRLLSFCGAVALCIMTGNSAEGQSRAFARSSGLQAESSNMVRNGLFIKGDESYRVVNTAAFRTAADIGTTEAGSIAQVGFRGGCHLCGTSCGGSCGGSYGSCGNYGNPCAPCNPYCYVVAEALYMEPDAEARDFSRDFRNAVFDDQTAARITIGAVPDCVHGYEATYVGPFEWDVFGAASDPAFGLDTLLVPGLPLTSSDLSAFNNAEFQSLAYSAEYWSVEFNKTLVGWDVAKLLAGVRYISYEEQLAYSSRNLTESGFLNSDVDNQMWGLQVGMDLLYPIAKHTYTDLRTRIGGFINSADSNVRLDNAGARILRAHDDETEIAGMFELGSGIRCQLGQIFSVRAGVELWYLSGVASAPDQISNVIRPSTGRDIEADDDVLFTGLSVGAELKY